MIPRSGVPAASAIRLLCLACLSGLMVAASVALSQPAALRNASATSSMEAYPVAVDLAAEAAIQWRSLQGQIARREAIRHVADQALRPEALIEEGDRDGLDVLLRRTRALGRHLQQAGAGRRAGELLGRLDAIAAAADLRGADRQKLFAEALGLQRQIALTNPLLNFDRLVFIKRHRSGANHMCDQYFGHKWRAGGGLFILEKPFSEQPRLVDVLARSAVENGRLKGQALTGAFLSPDLSYDGKTVVFAHSEARGGGWNPGASFHLFRVGIDGSDLTQLTDGRENDFDPCWLPNGRIAFISERRGGFGRCHGRPVPTYTLHSCLPDGSDIVALSYHETNEWHPSVNNDGLIVYSRWDYVDRDSDIAHHPWLTTPDGRDARSIHGNYPRFPHGRSARPWMELDVKPIPGSHRYVAVAAPHHGQAWGSLVLLDADLEDDDAVSQLRRITPEQPFPEAEGSRDAVPFASPWPLSEDFYLCAYSPPAVDARGRSASTATDGLYLVDSFGNRVLLYRDAQIHSHSPIPLRPRPAPPEMPHVARQGLPAGAAASPQPDAPARVVVINVYESLKDWPEAAQSKALRIVQLVPKATPKADSPRIGIAAQSLARGVLGTVPVEADGSCPFLLPPGKCVYFQALDEHGRAVQSMRSDTYAQPGQTLACMGCHEPKHEAPPIPRAVPLALQREPSTIEPEFEAANPLSYPRLVQPVLDKACVGCHARSKGAPPLTGGPAANGWSQSYATLSRLGTWYNGGNGAMRNSQHGHSRSTPGATGAYASRLYQMLAAGHHDVKLTDEQMRRITLWLDTNSNFFGAYHDLDRQLKGEVVIPPLE